MILVPPGAVKCTVRAAARATPDAGDAGADGTGGESEAFGAASGEIPELFPGRP